MFTDTIFFVKCKGRDTKRQEVLKEPVRVEVHIHGVPENDQSINIGVKCPYNTGSHGHRCKASHPEQDKVGDGVPCPYVVDLPSTMDKVKF